MFALEAFYRRTTLGRAMRAVAFNRTTAGLMGINPNRIALIAYALAAAIGALAGILIAPVVQAAPAMGALIGLKAFGVAIVAGIANARGVVIVGLCYGVIEKFIEGYISTGARNAVGFTLDDPRPAALPARHFRPARGRQGMTAAPAVPRHPGARRRPSWSCSGSSSRPATRSA